MKEKILHLRNEKKSYREIEKILGCSKATISYHCGEGQKDKFRQRQRKNRSKVSGIIKKKIQVFVRSKIRSFKKSGHGHSVKHLTKSAFNYNSAFKLIHKSTECYISGRKIQIDIPCSYHLDHKTPTSRGGKNTLKNMGVACREANQAKNDLEINEFIELCIEICIHNGYSVEKKQ